MDNRITTQEIIELLNGLLQDRRFKHDEKLKQACEEYPELEDLVETLIELRAVTSSLSKGALDEVIKNHGYVLSSIKALQANLNHLVWQLDQVSKGDFSQRIDFLGDFSDSFNAMCEKLEKQNASLVELAHYDGLTKLANRQYLDEHLESLFDGSRKSDTEFSLLMIDLDFFKKVNDTYGHTVGDKVLEQAAQYMKLLFRSSDFLARYGGEEFLVILPHVSLEQAEIIAQRTKEYFEAHPMKIQDEEEIVITISVGITQTTEEDISAEQVVQRGDEALYCAKKKGRNRVERA